ncbi:2Fe-2S iron-sulfur cluster-binding protein [Herbidospora cretacea]|uniref:2Fe-2S iron-sulfur cluster-binding protein n=1 Tax=Herbidospora cretacea TaxID=28444 RepID=UPI00077302F2|nr:2Fe-2S iron-sulfur cluster binding domain-containing protein [Herbidospora cretacea]
MTHEFSRVGRFQFGTGVALPQSCGEGACGTCRVRVLSGAHETDARGMFSAAELSAGRRLACQTRPTEDLVISR